MIPLARGLHLDIFHRYNNNLLQPHIYSLVDLAALHNTG